MKMHGRNRILYSLVAIATVLTITSCSDKNDTKTPFLEPTEPIQPIDDPTPIHEHVFNKEVPNEKYLANPSTYLEPATYYYSCECGEHGEETFSFGDVLSHDNHVFKEEIIREATLEQPGLVKYTCEECNYSYEEEFTIVGKEYDLLEFVETHGTEFFDTGVTVGIGKSTIHIEASQNTQSQVGCLVGAGTSDTKGNGWGFYTFSSANYAFISPDYYWYQFGSSDVDRRVFDITIDGTTSQAKVNSEIIGNVNDSYWDISNPWRNTTFKIGKGSYEGGRNQFVGKIYSAKIYSDDVLVRDFVPARRKKDCRRGLFDLVNRVFYKNSGSGYIDSPESFSDDFKPVDYIQSTGSQGIRLSIPECDRWEIDFQYDWYGNEPCLIGDGDIEHKWGIFVHPTTHNYAFWDIKTGYTTSDISYKERVKAAYDYITGNCFLNGEVVASKTFLQPKYLFTYNYLYAYCASGKLYSCKFYKNNELVANLVPTMRTENKESGLFDVINNCFYMNQHNGCFTSVGSYRKVSYIEATGTQYIDSGVVASQNSKQVIDFEVTDERTAFDTVMVGAFDLSPIYPFRNKAVFNNIQTAPINVGERIRMITIINGENSSIDTNGERYEIPNYGSSFYTFWIFNQNYYGGQASWHDYRCCAKLYSLKLYQDDELVRDFIPVVREDTEKPGLLDLVNNGFYTNAGLDEFLVGEEETIENYEFLDSIDTTGVSGFSFFNSPTEITETEIKLKANPLLTNENSIFGSSWSDNGYCLKYHDSNFVFKTENATYETEAIDVTEVNTVHTYPRKTKEKLVVNGREFDIKENSTYSENTKDTLKFIGMDHTDIRSGGFTLYYFKLWEGEKLIHNFIPARNKSSNNSGIYDLVENKFYEFDNQENNDFCDTLLTKTTEFNIEKLKFAVDAEDEFDAVKLDFNGFSKFDSKGYHTLSSFYHNELEKTEPSWDDTGTIGYQLVYKRCFIEGKIVDSYVLLLQCTCSDGDNYDNISVGEPGRRFHKGFEKTADNVMKMLLDNIISFDVELNLFIAGYSRGSAVGGVLSSKLMENTPYFDENNLSAYLIACPRYSRKQVCHKNIFIINNPGDIVPEVPLATWGFGVEGQIITLDITKKGVIKEVNERVLYDYNLGLSKYPSYNGFTNTDEFIEIINKFSGYPQIASFESNEKYMNEIAKMFLDEYFDFNVFIDSASNIIVNLLKESIFVSPGDLIRLGRFFMFNQKAIFSSHSIYLYKQFVHVIYGD